MSPRGRGTPVTARPPRSPPPSRRNTMEALPACLLRDVYQEALGAAVIGIDEGQFVSAWRGSLGGSAPCRDAP